VPRCDGDVLIMTNPERQAAPSEALRLTSAMGAVWKLVLPRTLGLRRVGHVHMPALTCPAGIFIRDLDPSLPADVSVAEALEHCIAELRVEVWGACSARLGLLGTSRLFAFRRRPGSRENIVKSSLQLGTRTSPGRVVPVLPSTNGRGRDVEGRSELHLGHPASRADSLDQACPRLLLAPSKWNDIGHHNSMPSSPAALPHKRDRPPCLPRLGRPRRYVWHVRFSTGQVQMAWHVGS
jgi:hypothetical protein